MARILGIGIATLDIVNEVDGYPPEDAEVRAVAQHLRRGGNATNTLVVLSQLGHQCAWGGILAEDPNADHIRADLARHRIDTRWCHTLAGGKVPTSYITLSRRTGSRTIVHYRDLPEFSFADFEAIDLAAFDWLHFEARNVPDTRAMLHHARRLRPELPISLELEKARPDIETLIALPDVLLCSRAFALREGPRTPEAFLRALHANAPAAEIYLGWGAGGAYALDRAGEVYQCPATRVQVVDSVGAGDVFNAGVIDACLRGAAPAEALRAATQLAGRKCAQQGLDGLCA